MGADPLESSDEGVRVGFRFRDLFGSKVCRVALLIELVGSEPFTFGVLPAAANKVPNYDLSLYLIK